VIALLQSQAKEIERLTSLPCDSDRANDWLKWKAPEYVMDSLWAWRRIADIGLAKHKAEIERLTMAVETERGVSDDTLLDDLRSNHTAIGRDVSVYSRAVSEIELLESELRVERCRTDQQIKDKHRILREYQTEIERITHELDEARDAATQCYRRFRGTITGRAILKRWPWLERESEG
jgi:hypothetical protein